MATNNGFTHDDDYQAPGSQNGGSMVQLKEEKVDYQNMTFAEKFAAYPKRTFLIVGNEFCERYCFYGLSGVLTFYMIHGLKFDANIAVSIVSAFSALCYFTPVMGSILADGYFGKYPTIFWLSLVYACGSIILSVASTQTDHVHPWLDLIGLLIIAIGTGGIKPCVVSFGADQFKPGQEAWRDRFFSIFYFSINAGGLLTTYISPELRALPCMNQDTCYPLAFGVPAALMVVACCFFIFGTFWYDKYPPQGNVVAEVFKVIIGALRNRSTFAIKREHWTEHYLDSHMCSHDEKCKELGYCHKAQLVKDVRAVLRVLVMYIPMPFFWALYNQQFTWWVIQGAEMDGRLGSLIVLPEQMGIANTVMILAFIPLFSGIIYPLASKCVRLTPLRKMAAGGFLVIITYVVCTLVQLKVNATLPDVPASGMTRVEFVNYVPCDATITLNDAVKTVVRPSDDQSVINSTKFDQLKAASIEYTILFSGDDNRCNGKTISKSFTADGGSVYYGTIALVKGEVQCFTDTANMEKPNDGTGAFVMNINYMLPDVDNVHNFTEYQVSICKLQSNDTNDSIKAGNFACQGSGDNTYTVAFDYDTRTSDFNQIIPGEWHLVLTLPDASQPLIYIGKMTINEQGGIYTTTIYNSNITTFDDLKNQKINFHYYPLAPANSVNIFLQLPQFVIVTAAEILFSITGLEFSYSQAPPSMKAVLQAAWLFCTGLGFIIILIFALAKPFDNLAYSFAMFGAIMVVVMIVFVLLSVYYYEYVFFEQVDSEQEAEKRKKKQSSA